MEMLELATDLKGARDEINRLRADYALLADDYMQLLGDVERLRAELAECDENAERYQWLRANWDRVATRVASDNAATYVVRIELLDRRSYRPLDVSSLDAALDEARKGEGE